ncbi:hypothetical protein TcBrA4_0051600 [Trypanosoma cruzi]|nr:hypothetical protein TcBrA4_0051600 [Trypanosoma cruzi]
MWTPSSTTDPRETLKFYAVTCRGATPHEGLCADPASSMAAPQSLGRDVVTPQQAVELGTDEYAALRDGMARRLNCEGAVVYRLQRGGGCCADVEAAFPRIRNGACGTGGHRHAPFVRCGALLEARRQARRAARGGASAASATGKRKASTTLCGLAAWLQTCAADGSRCKTSSRRCVAADAHVRSQVMHYEPSPATPDAVVCVGLQGCGKSTFSRHPVRSAAPGTAFAMLDQPKTRPAEAGSFLAPFGARSEVATRTLSSTR